MDVIPILTTLWRRRLLVAPSMLVALAVGISMAFNVSGFPPQLRSRQYQVGLAIANALVDTPQSAVADLNPTGADTLQTRTLLLANLMGTTAVQNTIASEIGIPPGLLTVSGGSSSGAPVISTSLATTVDSQAPPSKAYQLDVNTIGTLPVISFQAQAPSAQRAAALAGAAVHALRHYLGTVGAGEKIPVSRRPVITALGVPLSGNVLRGPKKLYAVLAAAGLFVFLCTLIVVGTGLARGLRKARGADSQLLADGHPELPRDERPPGHSAPNPAHPSALDELMEDAPWLTPELVASELGPAKNGIGQVHNDDVAALVAEAAQTITKRTNPVREDRVDD